jgi:hypothetical protein
VKRPFGQEQEKAQLKKAELQKKLDDAGEQLAAAKRKMEQGSQALQGEVLELAIEEGIRRAFPFDLIEEVKKGQRGGDLLQHVLTAPANPPAPFPGRQVSISVFFGHNFSNLWPLGHVGQGSRC